MRNIVTVGFDKKCQHLYFSDIFIGGIITRPSNAFPRTDKNATIIFNCTTRSKYSPWWTFSQKMTNRTITNSSCGVITPVVPTSFANTEKLGPGSCNLIVTILANRYYSSAVIFVCTDATLSSARAILQHIRKCFINLFSYRKKPIGLT